MQSLQLKAHLEDGVQTKLHDLSALMFSSFQDALLTSGFISKSRPLQETERQKSSDILEELRMQGIIGSQSTAARTGEAHENKVSIITRHRISAMEF